MLDRCEGPISQAFKHNHDGITTIRVVYANADGTETESENPRYGTRRAIDDDDVPEPLDPVSARTERESQRPPQRPSLTAWLRVLLEETEDDGRTKGERLAAKVIELALDGDVKAAKLCFDRHDGKVPLHVQLEQNLKGYHSSCTPDHLWTVVDDDDSEPRVDQAAE